jgi:hypothetical protein
MDTLQLNRDGRNPVAINQQERQTNGGYEPQLNAYQNDDETYDEIIDDSYQDIIGNPYLELDPEENA